MNGEKRNTANEKQKENKGYPYRRGGEKNKRVKKKHLNIMLIASVAGINFAFGLLIKTFISQNYNNAFVFLFLSLIMIVAKPFIDISDKFYYEENENKTI